MAQTRGTFDPRESSARAFAFVHGRDPTDSELDAVVQGTPALDAGAMDHLGMIDVKLSAEEWQGVKQARSQGLQSLCAAVTWYCANRRPSRDRLLPELVAEFLATKRCQNVGVKSMILYQSHMRGLMAGFPGRTAASIAPREVRDYLAQWKTTYTQASRWQTMATFFTWLERVHYVDANPVRQAMRRPSVGKVERRILTTAEAAAVLREAQHNDTIGFWALSLFAGMRNSEILALQRHLDPWGVINFESGVIDLRGEITKTSMRTVPISPVLKAWLLWLRPQNIPFYPRNFQNRCMQVRDAALTMHQFKRRPGAGQLRGDSFLALNLGRRSYISYRLALPQASYVEVSRAVGNSEEILRKHYEQKAAPTEALKYFSLTPEVVGTP